MPGILSEEERQAASIYSMNCHSVFQIDSGKGYGSGFMWDEEGFVATNFHVIQNASNIKVKCFDGKIYDAKIVGSWPDRDVALLYVEELKGKVKPLSIDVDADLFIGKKVFAIGNPYGLTHSLSAGFISGLQREDKSASSGKPMQDLIQTDAAINVGSSGGPLFDSAGHVIGITTSICSASGEWGGIGLSISIRSVFFLIDCLVKLYNSFDSCIFKIISAKYVENVPAARSAFRYHLLQEPSLQEFYPNNFHRYNRRWHLREDISEVIGRPLPDFIQTVTAKNVGNSGGPQFDRTGQGLQKTKLDDLGFVIRKACGKIVAKGFGLVSYLHLCEAGDTVTVTVEQLCGGKKKNISVTLAVS